MSLDNKTRLQGTLLVWGSQVLDQGCDPSLLFSSGLHPGGYNSVVGVALGSGEKEGALGRLGEWLSPS